MLTVNLLLMILAIVCLGLAGLGISAPRVSLGWLGLMFWAIAFALK